MGSLLVTGIGELVTNDPTVGDGSPLGLLHDAAVVIEDREIAWVGNASQASTATDDVLDVEGRAVIPGFVDSHAHPVFAGDRTGEFVARMAGQRYAAGGIQATVAATRAASDEQLLANVQRLADEFLRHGVTTFEAKSGYGLDVANEARSLRIAATVTDELTFLGAHVTGPEYAGDVPGYVALVTGAMLDHCGPLATWCDVFVEDGAFGADEARAVLQAGLRHGLTPRVHANQLGPGPGVQIACEMGAASADHCTYLSGADIDALASCDTVATLLPGAEFSTRSPWPDARRLLDAGATVAIATDCNPGSSYTTSMPLMVALAVRDCSMSPAEALWSATAGGASALRRLDVGRLVPTSSADLVVLDAPSHVHLAYRPGVHLIHQVLRRGVLA